jgi:hypothetical protein
VRFTLYYQLGIVRRPDNSAGLAKIQATVCDRPYESRNAQIRITTIVCTVIGNIAVLLRLASRFILNHSLALDDWFIIAAAVSQLPPVLVYDYLTPSHQISEGLFAYFGVQKYVMFWPFNSRGTITDDIN